MRLLPALVLVAGLLGAATACGSDGADPKGSPSGSSTSTSSASQRACRVTATFTGAEQGSLKADAYVQMGSGAGPAATYLARDDSSYSLQAFSSGDGGLPPALILITARGAAYRAESGASGLDIKTDGSGASIDTDVTDEGGKTAHVTATFDC